MPLLKPLEFLDDSEIRPFIQNQRVDLKASNCPILSTNKYIIFSYEVPAGQCLIVKGMSFYACERTDIGTTTEAFGYLDPLVANGYFSYQPLVDRNTPYLVNLSFNSPKIASGTLNNNDKQGSPGYTEISANPTQDIRMVENPLFSIAVPSSKRFEIVFSVLPVSTLNSANIPTGGQYQVGTGAKRVDFAGAIIAGLLMPQQTYDQIKNAVQSLTVKELLSG